MLRKLADYLWGLVAVLRQREQILSRRDELLAEREVLLTQRGKLLGEQDGHPAMN